MFLIKLQHKYVCIVHHIILLSISRTQLTRNLFSLPLTVFFLSTVGLVLRSCYSKVGQSWHAPPLLSPLSAQISSITSSSHISALHTSCCPTFLIHLYRLQKTRRSIPQSNSLRFEKRCPFLTVGKCWSKFSKMNKFSILFLDFSKCFGQSSLVFFRSGRIKLLSVYILLSFLPQKYMPSNHNNVSFSDLQISYNQLMLTYLFQLLDRRGRILPDLHAECLGLRRVTATRTTPCT